MWTISSCRQHNIESWACLEKHMHFGAYSIAFHKRQSMHKIGAKWRCKPSVRFVFKWQIYHLGVLYFYVFFTKKRNTGLSYNVCMHFMWNKEMTASYHVSTIFLKNIPSNSIEAVKRDTHFMSFRFTLFLQISLQKIRSHSHERSLFLNKKFVSIRKWKTKRKSTRGMGSGQCPLDTKRFVIRGINDGEQEPTKNSQEMAKNRDKWKSLKVFNIEKWKG